MVPKITTRTARTKPLVLLVEKKAESPAPPGWQVVWWRRSPNPLDSVVSEGTCQGLWELWTWELLYGFILPHRIQKKIIQQKQQALLVDMTKSVLGSWGLQLPLDSWWLSPGLQSPGVMTPDHLQGSALPPGLGLSSLLGLPLSLTRGPGVALPIPPDSFAGVQGLDSNPLPIPSLREWNREESGRGVPTTFCSLPPPGFSLR